MKKIPLLLVLMAIASSVQSQNHDLIVKTNGDSVVCKIDSISDASIYFKMKSYDNWIHTMLSRNEVSEYKYNAITWKEYVYKPGTSYILSAIVPINSVRDLPKNSVHIGFHIIAISVIYNRMIPAGEGIGFLAGAGFISSFFESSGTPNPVVRPGIILGNGKHFFEGGLYINLMSENGGIDFLPELGYRYQGPRGFLFRAHVTTSEDISLLPGISAGYSF